jgi:hypothetical protein
VGKKKGGKGVVCCVLQNKKEKEEKEIREGERGGVVNTNGRNDIILCR